MVRRKSVETVHVCVPYYEVCCLKAIPATAVAVAVCGFFFCWFLRSFMLVFLGRDF